ncbi:hypothetical protein ACGF0D_38780 [Kitasatospora sp. NPDC048298]|uniref:hypothetical protein n=1 Tax=Kitasatospora sp. NPDC048298 TaxID=3364049 RepID=UPI003723087E
MHSASLAATTAYTVPQLWRVLTKAGYFIGLSAAIGTTVTYVTTVRPALRNAGSADTGAMRKRAAAYLAVSGIVFLVAGYFQLAARLARAGKGMPFGDALSPGRLWDYLQAPAA